MKMIRNNHPLIAINAASETSIKVTSNLNKDLVAIFYLFILNYNKYHIFLEANVMFLI